MNLSVDMAQWIKASAVFLENWTHSEQPTVTCNSRPRGADAPFCLSTGPGTHGEHSHKHTDTLNKNKI